MMPIPDPLIETATHVSTKVAIGSGVSGAGLLIAGVPASDVGALLTIALAAIAFVVNLVLQFESRKRKIKAEQASETRQKTEHEARMAAIRRSLPADEVPHAPPQPDH